MKPTLPETLIHYTERGSGEALVLLHGFGEDHRIWEQLAPALTAYRVILPDLPGTGSSPFDERLSIESMAEAVKELLDAIGIDRCVIIGHSMGGYVALAFAEQWGDRLNGLGLFHSTAYADTDAKKETRQKGIAFIRQHGPLAFLKTTIPNLFAPLEVHDRKAMIEELIRRSDNFSGEALVLYYEAMMKRKDRTDVLRKLACPVLFILGVHDAAIPFQDGLEQTYLPSLSYIHVLRASGHAGMLEEAEKVEKIIKQYLQDLPYLA